MRSVLISLISLCLITATPESVVCTCDGDDTVAENVRWATHIFSGTVLSKSIDGYVAYYKFKVDKALKGVFLSDTIFVITGSRSASCGLNMTAGTAAFIYADQHNYLGTSYKSDHVNKLSQTLWTNSCTRSRFSHVEVEMEAAKKMLYK
jgi:hypothetical protein